MKTVTRVHDIPADACWEVFEAINNAWLRSPSGWFVELAQNIDRFVDVGKGRCDKLPDDVEFHPLFTEMALQRYGALYKRRESQGTLPAHWLPVRD